MASDIFLAVNHQMSVGSSWTAHTLSLLRKNCETHQGEARFPCHTGGGQVNCPCENLSLLVRPPAPLTFSFFFFLCNNTSSSLSTVSSQVNSSSAPFFPSNASDSLILSSLSSHHLPIFFYTEAQLCYYGKKRQWDVSGAAAQPFGGRICA